MLVAIPNAFAGTGERTVVTAPKLQCGKIKAKTVVMPSVSMKDAVPSSRAAEDGKYTLTFSIEETEEMTVTSPLIRIVGENIQMTVFKDFAAGNWHVDLDEGEYVLLSFVDMPSGGNGYYVKDVMLTGDTEIRASVTDVKNTVSFKSLNPNGSDTKLQGYQFNPESETGMDLVEGNVTMFMASNSIWHKKFGYISGTTYSIPYNLYNVEGELVSDADKDASLSTNDLSDDFSVYQIRFLSAPDGFYLAASEPIIGLKENKEAVIGNKYNPEPYEPHFALSPKGLESQLEWQIPANDNHFEADLVVGDGNNLKITSAQMSGGAYSPKSSVFIDEKVKALPVSVGLKMYAFDIYEKTDENTFSAWTISGQPTILSNDDPETEFLNDAMIYRVGTAESQPEGHPGFSFSENEAVNIAGDNVPSVMIVPTFSADWETGETTKIIYPVLTGRVGEVMTAYPTTTLKDEGKTITVEDANRNIDGIEGRVSARFEFADEKSQFAPQLVQLQFRSSDGKVTDRFNQAVDGIVLLAAADFNPNFHEGGYIVNYSIGPADLKIEYAPNGSDDWTELEIAEKPEFYFEPGYGHFYESSLKFVDKPSANKWYDLKIAITDPDGNSNVQTISPAFRIDSLSSLKSISASDVTNGDSAYYNIMGVRIDKPEKGQLLIRVDNGSVSKVIVK